MAEKFTPAETLAISAAKTDIADAKRRIRRVEDARRAREKEAVAKTMVSRAKQTRDNKIRAALLEMAETAKKYGMAFDAPPKPVGWRYSPQRQASFKIVVTDVSGRNETVQIYTRADGFEWD
jgi:hypothetical protein